MSAMPFSFPIFKAFTTTGTLGPLAGGLLHTFEAGTSTPLAVYQDAALTVPHTNPVVLDSNGQATIYLGPNAYKMRLEDSAGAVQPGWPIDGIEDPLDNAKDYTDTLRSDLAASSGSSLIGFLQSGTGAVARTLQDKGRESVSVHDYMTVAQIADAESGVMALDLRNALQAAIDAAIILQKKLMWPKGNYRIDSPLHVWDWTGSAFRYFCFEAEGEKAPWTDYTTNRCGTFITATFNDRPAVMVQQARSFVFRNITVSGQNDIVSLMGVLPTFTGLFTNSNYVTNGCRDTRYSPYAGICIDPFGTSVPADGGYPGYSAYYLGGNAGSMYTLLDSVIVQKFVVAIALTPNGNTQNNEDVTLYSCKTMYNKVSLSIGQSQSRNVNVYGHTAWFHLVAFDGLSYGQRQGFLPNIFGANISLAKYFTASTSSFNTTLGVYNVYTEQLGSIGFLSSNSPASIHNGIVFSGCTFKFGSSNGITPDYHVVAWCPVVFSGCTITTSDKNFPLRIRHDTPATSITFTGCNFRFGTSEATFGFHSTNRGGEIDDLVFNNNILSMQSPSSTHTFAHDIYRFTQSSMNKKFVPMGARLTFGDSVDKTYVVGALSTGHDLNLGTVALTVAGSGNGSFTVSDGAIVRVGDVIRCATSVNYEGAIILDGSTISSAYNAIGVVTSVVGNDVSITGIPQGISSGSYALYKSWTPRYHSATTGDTNSNTSLTNVANAAAWSIGDPIRGTGIPAGAYITNIVGTTITISKAATATAVGVRLYDANIYVFTGTAV